MSYLVMSCLVFVLCADDFGSTCADRAHSVHPLVIPPGTLLDVLCVLCFALVDDWYVLDSEPNSFVLVVYRGSNDAWDGYGGGTLYTKVCMYVSMYLCMLSHVTPVNVSLVGRRVSWASLACPVFVLFCLFVCFLTLSYIALVPWSPKHPWEPARSARPWSQKQKNS